MKATHSTIFFTTLCMALCASAASYGQTEERIKELSLKKFQWLIDKQYDSLEQFLGRDLMYIHSNGWIENRQDVIDDLKTGKLTYKDVTVSESTVRVYGNAAVLVAKGTFRVMLGQTEGIFELLFTEVYTKEDGKWKIISRHACKI